jgi:hypothetical protein
MLLLLLSLCKDAAICIGEYLLPPLLLRALASEAYLAYQQANRSPYALEIDATKDTTDVGIQYRIRMTNVGTQQLSGIIVELGSNDIQNKSFLEPGQTYYFYPDPETNISSVKVKTNEGIAIESNYRSPAKVLGLPGAGR